MRAFFSPSSRLRVSRPLALLMNTLNLLGPSLLLCALVLLGVSRWGGFEPETQDRMLLIAVLLVATALVIRLVWGIAIRLIARAHAADADNVSDATDEPLPDSLVEESTQSMRKALLKMLFTVGVMVTALLILHFSPIRGLLEDVQAWKARLSGIGLSGILLSAGAAALLVATGVPRLWLSALAGAMFGFRIGFLVAWTGAGLGAVLAFAFVRWGARDSVQHLLKGSQRLQDMLKQPGILSVLLVRQLPLWGLAQNAILALTRIRARHYIIGTVLGILPSTAVFALIGSGLGKASLAEAMRNITAAVVIIASLGAVLWVLRNHRRKTPCQPL